MGTTRRKFVVCAVAFSCSVAGLLVGIELLILVAVLLGSRASQPLMGPIAMLLLFGIPVLATFAGIDLGGRITGARR